MPKRSDPEDIFETQSIAVPRFGSGEVAQILGVELWQLNRFLSRYELKASGQLGEGRGSRRVFNEEDIYRVATAMFLIRDGFAPKLVAQIMTTLEDEDFYGGVDDEGEFSEFGISLYRTRAGPGVRIFRADKFPEVSADSTTYYAVSLGNITSSVHRRISSLKKQET